MNVIIITVMFTWARSTSQYCIIRVHVNIAIVCLLVLTFHLQSLRRFICHSCWCSNFVSADWTSESAFCFGASSGELPQTGCRNPSAALQQDRGQVCVVEQTTKFVNLASTFKWNLSSHKKTMQLQASILKGLVHPKMMSSFSHPNL